MAKEEFDRLTNVFKSNWSGVEYLDRHVYVPMFGYKDVNEYYHEVSIDRFTSNIAVPTFALGSVDDPICGGYELVPMNDIQKENSQLFLATTSCGSHACHMTGALKPTSWY